MIVDCRESLSLFHLVSPLLDWSGTFWLLGVVGGFGFCFGLISLSNDDNLAQLNDCHSCNDAGSLVQKKDRNGLSVFDINFFGVLILHVLCKV